MKPLTIARVLVPLLLAALCFAGGYVWRDRVCVRDAALLAAQTARAQTAAVVAARINEQTAGVALADIGAKHETAREAAETVPAAVAADLRAGNLRLRREWQGCETGRVSDAAAAARERDALTASRDALAGALVRAGRDADDQLRAAQQVILADRAAINGGAQ